MSAPFKPKDSAPHAYDHVWVLPILVAFVAAIVLVAATNDRPTQGGNAAELAPLSTATAAPSPQRATDTSVPSAAAAMAKLPDVVAEPVATY